MLNFAAFPGCSLLVGCPSFCLGSRFACNCRYRTQLCPEGARCQRNHCWHAHSQDELRQPTEVPETNPVTLTPEAATAIAQAAIQSSAPRSEAGGTQRHPRQHMGPPHGSYPRVSGSRGPSTSRMQGAQRSSFQAQPAWGQHTGASIPQHSPQQQQGARWATPQPHRGQVVMHAGPGQQQQVGHMGQSQMATQLAAYGQQQYSQGMVASLQQGPQQLPTGPGVQYAVHAPQYQHAVQYSQGMVQPMQLQVQQPQQVQYVYQQPVQAGQVIMQHSPQVGVGLQQPTPQQQQLLLTVPGMPLQQQQPFQLSRGMQTIPQQQQAQVMGLATQQGAGYTVLAHSQACAGFAGDSAAWGMGSAQPYQQTALVAVPSGPGSNSGSLPAPVAAAGMGVQGALAGLGPGVVLIPAGAGAGAGTGNFSGAPSAQAPLSLGGYYVSQVPLDGAQVAGDSSTMLEGATGQVANQGIAHLTGAGRGVQQQGPAQQHQQEQQQLVLQQLMQRFGL